MIMLLSLEKSVEVLLDGGVLAVPTETVFGLAALVSQPKAIAKIFEIKNRPSDNPLIIHLPRDENVTKYWDKVPADFEKLQEFWPGPLTIVATAKSGISSAITAGLSTVALRKPAHEALQSLLDKVGAFVAPSANLSGFPSATKAAHIEKDFGQDFPVFDGGECSKGVESTVVLLEDDGWCLLRKGAIAKETLIERLGDPKSFEKREKPIAPGMKYRHYSPKCRLTRWDGCLGGEDAVLGFDDTVYQGRVLSLGKRNDPETNLRKLYSALRSLDEEGLNLVALDLEFSETGLGATLLDRLKKALSS